MEAIQERLDIYYKNEFFQKHKGLAEAIVDFEIKLGLKMPNDFIIPPFVYYHIGEHQVLFGKVHKYYVFAMQTNGVFQYRLFENKPALKLFFTQMSGLEREDLAFWLTEVENIEWSIQKILDESKEG